eukprot:CAMPEP_0182912284 /NCGR_PEP_ID=MMETSP0034_2-20130328/37433_1 /TAXON_ID=156128 /ORGANISM="Nephroselmis pyriformis, Strain CCMP717" /LENGTH=38 /DNA_ID= /DNA_START= /DNA_END= /DNA_ORIENTATION=
MPFWFSGANPPGGVQMPNGRPDRAELCWSARAVGPVAL